MRVSEKGKSVTFEVRAWWDEGDGTIHLASNESDTFITTVSDDSQSARGNPKLFRELARVLRDNGAPAPLVG